MKKLINFFAFILIVLLVIFIAIPTKTVNRNSAVYVEHEWDTLESVILGSPKMLSVPQIHDSILGYGYIVDNEKTMKKDMGKPIQQVNPYGYSVILEESNGLSTLLKEKEVSVTRLNPEVLDLAELQYLKFVQQGHNFMFPKDAVIVIGNTVIECAQRVPMRDKERFVVRRIFKPLLKADPSIRYIAVPIPSPSFPEKSFYLEGSDVLVDGKNVYVGFSGRGTSSSGIMWLQSALGPNYKVYTINFKDFVHLNSVLTLVRPNLGIKVSSSITSDLPNPLKNWEFIEVSAEDAKKYASSILVIGPNKVLVDERFETLISELRSRNVDVTSVPFEEISKFGGGLGSFYSPIRRAYNAEINSEKIDAEYFKKHGLEILDNIKSFDYAKFFEDAKNIIMEKVNSLTNR